MKKLHNLVSVVLAVVLVFALGAGVAEPAGNQLLGPIENAADYDGLLGWYFPCVVMFGENCRAGVEAYSADTGVPIKVVTGTELTQNAENTQIEAMQASGYKYFGIFGVDGAGVNGLYEELVDAGCVVNNLGWDSLRPNVANHLVSTDIPLSAEKGAEKLCELMGYKGNVIVCYGPITDTTFPQRQGAVHDVIAKYPDMQIIAELSDMITPESTLTKFGDGLAAHQNEVDGVLAVGAYGSSISSVLEEAYQKGAEKLKCVLIDIDDVMVKAIKDGVIDGTIVQNEFGIGYLSGEVLRLEADGWTPKADKYHIDTGVVYVDQSNIDTYADDLKVVTKDILAKLTTDYMEKN